MPTFQAQIDTIKDGQQNKDFRIACIKNIESITGRPLIVYAGNISRSNVPNNIDNSDIVGFSDLIEGIDGDNIDVFLLPHQVNLFSFLSSKKIYSYNYNIFISS